MGADETPEQADERKAKARARVALRRERLGLPPQQPRRKFANDEERENAKKEYQRNFKAKHRSPDYVPRKSHASIEDRIAANQEARKAKRAQLKEPGNEQLRAEMLEKERERRERLREKRGLPPTPRRLTFATEEARQAHVKAQLKEYRRTVGTPQINEKRERLREPGNEHLLKAHREQVREALQRNRERKGLPPQSRRMPTPAARLRSLNWFIRNVPAIIGSRERTRLIISLCEYGATNLFQIGHCVAPVSSAARKLTIQFLHDLGVVALQRTAKNRYGEAYSNPKMSRRIYYLNPGHPAHAELLAFGKALARRWPSPMRPTVEVAATARPLAKAAPFPANLFGQEIAHRILLLVAVTGGITPSQIYEQALSSSPTVASNLLKAYMRRGMVSQDRPPGRGGGRGGPQPFRLDPGFFAYAELRNLLWKIAATVNDDIVGIARTVALNDPKIAEHVALFEREMHGAAKRTVF